MAYKDILVVADDTPECEERVEWPSGSRCGTTPTPSG